MFSSSVGNLSAFLDCLYHTYRGLIIDFEDGEIRLAFFFVLCVHIICLNATIIDRRYPHVVMDFGSKNARC